MSKVNLEAVRQAVAEYMYSEGCSCCRDIDAHSVNKKRLAELLNVPLYSDGSGYDFSLFRLSASPTLRAADLGWTCAHCGRENTGNTCTGCGYGATYRPSC